MVVTGNSPYPQDVATFQGFLEDYSLIVIKSCFGASQPSEMGSPSDTSVIDDAISGQTWYRMKWHWRSIIRAMQSYPDNFFIIWTGIPLVPGGGYDGTIAHQFVTWAKDTLATGLDAVYGDFRIMFMCLIVFIYWQFHQFGK